MVEYDLASSTMKVMDDFFVYANIYSSTKDTDKFEKLLAFILFIIIMLLSFLGLLKSLILLMYFLMFNISNYCNVFTRLLCSGCKINMCKALKKYCILTYSEIKKFYLFNFYSFPNKAKGFFLIFLYMIFVFYNITFTFLTFKLNKDTIDNYLILMVVCYFINMFFELFLPIFYYTRKEKKFAIYLLCTYIFAILGFSCCVYGLIHFYSFEVMSYRFYVMGYYTLLIILNFFALRKIYHYNPTKKSMKKYISQPYKSSNNDETIMISVYSDDEINILVNKFPLKNIYLTNKGKGLYYHSRDRFYYQKTLLCFFILSVIIKVLTLGLIIILTIRGNKSKEDNKNINHTKKCMLVLDTALLYTIAWFTFMKIEIKKYTLY